MLVVDKVQPKANCILVTKDVYKEDVYEGIMITHPAGSLKDHQTVFAVGPMVHQLKEGDVVKVNLSNYAVQKYKDKGKSIAESMDPNMESVLYYNIREVEIHGMPYMVITDQDIDYKVLDSHEEPDPIKPIIQPVQPKLIV